MSPVYRYTAKSWEGDTRKGTTKASNLQEALEYLRSQGLIVVDVKAGKEQQEGSQQSLLESFKKLSPTHKAKSRDFMVFCRQFATMIQAGMTALHSLQVLAQQMEHPGFRRRLQQVAISVEQGTPMWEAFEQHSDFFPRILISMVESGEAGGMLDTVLENLADHFEKQNDLEEKIRSATTYPVVVAVVAVAVLMLMVFFVLPQFANIFADLGIELPLITRIVIGVSSFVVTYWYVVLGAVVAVLLLSWRYLQTERGRWFYDRFKLRVPLFGSIYQKTVVARFSRTFSSLLTSGVGVLSALELVERVLDNRVVGEALERTRDRVQKGLPMASTLEQSGLFPVLLVEMVHVGEETGSLDDMLARSADFYEGEVSYVMDRLSTIIEPLLLIVIGAFIGIMVASIVLPMFQMGDFL